MSDRTLKLKNLKTSKTNLNFPTPLRVQHFSTRK